MNTDKILKIGRSDFGLFIKNGYYLVDKTKLIYDFHHNANDIVLFPRPKRFGKTLNLSMIEYFFDKNKEDTKELFSEFEIAQKNEFCDEHQNKYPVINISLKDIKASDWEKCYNKFKIEISDLFKKHQYLLSSDELTELDKKNFNQILHKEATQAEYEYSLMHLSEYLKLHFDERVVILVDEYDTPIINAFKYTKPPIKTFQTENLTYYEKIISFMQTFLGKAYKGNDDNLHKGMITGVMRVGRESIFSEWNNFDVFGVTSNYFSNSFGFTEEETRKILNDFNLAHKIEDIKQWYDGYKFGKTGNIYNPWSIVSFIAKKQDGFKTYWINSGDYSLIKSRIIEIGVKETIQELIEGRIIEKELHENFVFQDFETDNELLWTLLTDNGYLTQIEKSDFGNYKLKIPNNEVKIVFTDIIRKWLDTEVKIKRDLLVNTSRNLINNNLPGFEKDFRKIIGDTLSYFDTAEKSDKITGDKIVTQEQIYHVYTLGLLAILSDDYMIKSNSESGEGRYDIALIPYNKSKNGVVIEIKSIKKQSKNEKDNDFRDRINKEIDCALEQIERKKYYKELIDYKIDLDKILRVPIVFAGKEPFVMKLSDE